MTGKAVACFVTPHGFGHAARAAALLTAVRARTPSVRFHIFTTVPRWFFRESLGDGFVHHSCVTDVGLVQRGPLEEDLPATVARLRAFYPPRADVVSGLAGRLRRLGCRLVVCDVAPLGLVAAREAGLPSVLVENFTWDWIYRGYAGREPRLLPIAAYLEPLFRSATLRIQTEPICAPASRALRVPPLGRPRRTPRRDVRRALGFSPRRPLVLVTMGGVPNPGFALAPLARLSGVDFLLVGGVTRPRREGNLLLLPHRSGHYHPDLVAAADAVVGKVGYSTLAEVVRAGIPYGYVPRPAFRESAVLAAWLRARAQGLAIGGPEFESGTWAARVPELLALGRRRGVASDGAGAAARAVLGLL